MIEKKVFSFSLTLISFLFISLYFILSFHARLVGDDFFYLWLKKSFGAWNGMMYQYEHWSGRWTAHYLGCLLLEVWKSPYLVPSVCILTFFLLFLSIKLILKNIFHFLKNEKISGINSLTVIIISTLFLTSFSIGETWFWYIIIITYLWSIIAFIFLLGIIFNQKKRSIDYFTIALSTTFIGGASESFALIFLMIILSILFFRIAQLKKTIFDETNIRLIASLIILAISFSFSVFAEGTLIRHSLLPHTTLIEKVVIVFKSFIKFFIRYLPGKLFYFLLFSVPWLVLGNICKKDILLEGFPLKKIGVITKIFIGLIFLMYIPTASVMSETGPDRALSIISFTTTFYFAIVFFIAGLHISFDSPLLKKITLLFSTLAAIVLCFHIYNQYTKVSVFLKAYNDRMRNIQNASMDNLSGTLSLEKMPDEGMLYWDELSTDTSYFTNQHLRDGLRLTFKVKLKE
jgi:hypothetical protein